jgi:hypothetical protein
MPSIREILLLTLHAASKILCNAPPDLRCAIENIYAHYGFSMSPFQYMLFNMFLIFWYIYRLTTQYEYEYYDEAAASEGHLQA